MTVRTACVVVVNSEAGGVVVLLTVDLPHNRQTSVSVRLDVMITVVDRLQSVVVRVERIRVHDEGRVGFEKW